RNHDGQIEKCKNWSFAVKAGDQLEYEWPISSFTENKYLLHLYGPNGFYREFQGTAKDPQIKINVRSEFKRMTKTATGNIVINVNNQGNSEVTIIVKDMSYKNGYIADKKIAANSSERIDVDLKNSSGWYDFTVTTPSDNNFLQRFAGRIETGKEG